MVAGPHGVHVTLHVVVVLKTVHVPIQHHPTAGHNVVGQQHKHVTQAHVH
jgi:hypothetical protein